MKIRFCSFLTIALFLLPALQGAERDSLSLLRTIAEYEALPAKWIETVYTNPATRYYQHCTSLTRISLNGVYGKEDESCPLASRQRLSERSGRRIVVDKAERSHPPVG